MLFHELIIKIQQLQKHEERLIIAVDGRGGAGKSSLARSLVAAIPGTVHIEYDWFHLPKIDVTDEHRFDNERLINQVIVPFNSGQSTLSFLRYNWGYLSGAEDGYDPTPILINDPEIMVIEGCETLHKTLVAYYKLGIWLDTEPEECLRRGRRRDIEEYKLEADRVNAAWEEWALWELTALKNDNRRDRADVIFRNEEV